MDTVRLGGWLVSRLFSWVNGTDSEPHSPSKCAVVNLL